MASFGSENLAPVSLFARAMARVKAPLADRSDARIAQLVAGNVFLVRVGSAPFALASQVLLARWMGRFEFGIFIYAWTWVLMIGALSDMGISSAARRFIPEYSERRSFDLLRGFLSGSKWLSFGIATVIGVLGAIAVTLFAPTLQSYEIVPLYLACLIIPVYGLVQIQAGIAQSYDWPNLALTPFYIWRQLAITLAVGGCWLAGASTGAVAAMAIAAAATWAVTLGQLAALNRRLGSEVPAGPKRYAVGTWLATSIPIFVVEAFYLLLTYVDILVLMHKFSRYDVTGERDRLAKFFADTARWTFWPSLGACALVLLFGKPLLALFGAEFAEGYGVMFILALGLLARAAVGPAERLLNMLGQRRQCAIVYATAFAINLGLCLLLIPRLGITGAAIATSTAIMTESIMLYIAARRRLSAAG